MSQCNHLPNDSKLPEDQTDITKTKLSPFDIEDEVYTQQLRKLVLTRLMGTMRYPEQC